jgi:hypothetical protein
MTVTDVPPIACTLAPAAYKDRMATIAALTRDALRSHERRDLVLELHYAPAARDRVRELIRNEQICCAFLRFDLREGRDEIRLNITAPETAREAADALFEDFVSGAPAPSACGCPPPASNAATPRPERQPGSKAAGLTAATLATSAVGCGGCAACCRLRCRPPPWRASEASWPGLPTCMYGSRRWLFSPSSRPGPGSHGKHGARDAGRRYPRSSSWSRRRP